MTKKELRIISLKYRTLSSQVLKIENDDKMYIKMFIDFIDETEFLHNYIVTCHNTDYDFKTITASRGFNHYLALPNTSEEIVDYGYQLLKYIVEGNVNLMGLTFGYSSSNSFADSIKAFMRKTIEPFIIAVREFIEIKCIEIDENSFEEPNKTSKSKNGITIFLSYCQKDTKFADLVESKLSEQLSSDSVRFSRDIRDVGYHESFKSFMDSIQDHDYVLMLISDNYLKSRNCLYEMLETIKDRKFADKLIYIILEDKDNQLVEGSNEKIGANLYNTDGQFEYVSYWIDKKNNLNDKINAIGNPAISISFIKELKHIEKILLELQDLMSFICEHKGVPLNEHINNNFNDILKFINQN